MGHTRAIKPWSLQTWRVTVLWAWRVGEGSRKVWEERGEGRGRLMFRTGAEEGGRERRRWWGEEEGSLTGQAWCRVTPEILGGNGAGTILMQGL